MVSVLIRKSMFRNEQVKIFFYEYLNETSFSFFSSIRVVKFIVHWCIVRSKIPKIRLYSSSWSFSMWIFLLNTLITHSDIYSNYLTIPKQQWQNVNYWAMEKYGKEQEQVIFLNIRFNFKWFNLNLNCRYWRLLRNQIHI